MMLTDSGIFKLNSVVFQMMSEGMTSREAICYLCAENFAVMDVFERLGEEVEA
jgi:hypothetical protein